jgi:cytochrome b561
MSEYEHEPVRGLPGDLPEDETILWQGSPDWRQLVAHALHIRLVALYFAGIAGWALLTGDGNTAIGVTVLGAVVVAMLIAFAWGVARTSVYTLTSKRVVLRIGVALNKCINLPLKEIEAANLKALGDSHGTIVLSLKGVPQLGYWLLWPHVRSLRVFRPQPALRAVPDAASVAQLLFRATQRLQPIAPADARADTRAAQSNPGPLVGATA